MVDTVLSDYGDGVSFNREAEIAVLANRLERGWALIEERTRSGADVSEYEAHWLNLLKEYESAYEMVHGAGSSTR